MKDAKEKTVFEEQRLHLLHLLLTVSEFWRREPSQAIKSLGDEKKGIVEVKKMLMNVCDK